MSFRTRRRSHVSNISSDTDGHQSNIGTSTMEPTDEYPFKVDNDFDQENFDNMIHTRPFPWIKIVIRIFNNVNLTCDHQIKCLTNCYDKQTKSCKNLLNALLNMYQLTSFKHNKITPNKKQRVKTFFLLYYFLNIHFLVFNFFIW